MNDDRPLLTIAIPTYNRSQCLAHLLDYLLPQVVAEKRVEIMISDNASQDDTQDVVKSYQAKGLKCLYIRNPANVGADSNFINCFNRARGEYVWIVGDDDVIVPGALSVILQHLEQRNFDLIAVGAFGFKDRYRGDQTTRFSGKIKIFADARQFALYVSTGLTFISGNITRKAALENIAHPDFASLQGTNLAQLGWTFSLLGANPRCAFLKDKFIASRQDNSGGIGTCHVFGNNLRSIVDTFFGTESPIGRAILNRTIQSWFPWAMMHNRRTCGARYIPEDAESILGNLYRRNPRYWLFLYPVLRLPLPLAEAWLFGVKVANRLDQLLDFPLAR